LARNPNALRLIFGISRLLWRHPSFFLPILLFVGAWYAYETEIARPAMAFQGVPQTADWRQINSWFRILRNDGFMLGYSDLRGNPLWVMYQLHPIKDNAPNLKRPRHFSPDWRGPKPHRP